MEFADAALSVGEYAVCLSARRHMALIGAFMHAAANAGSNASKRS
jgi:hypothetical protein